MDNINIVGVYGTTINVNKDDKVQLIRSNGIKITSPDNVITIEDCRNSTINGVPWEQYRKTLVKKN